MLKKIYKILSSLALAFLVSAVMVNPVLAAGNDVNLNNPLNSSSTISDIIDQVIEALRDQIAPPIVALMALVGGFQMLFAGGKPERFKNGKWTLIYAVIGYVIILLASGISEIIKDILTAGGP